jgi:hypothetical protein
MHAVVAAVTAVAAAAAAPVAAPTLVPLKYAPLPMGSVKPEGWLRRELRLQGDGLSGAFERFWEPVNNTQWLGGTSNFEDWVEIFPYVIAGYSAQAILLNDTAQMTTLHRWVNYLLAHQTAAGWLGPEGENDSGMLYWPRWPILVTFFQLFEATGDVRLINSSIAWLHEADRRLDTKPMGYDWTGVRWQDWLYVIQYLIDSPATPAAELPFLWTLTQRVYAAGKAIMCVAPLSRAMAAAIGRAGEDRAWMPRRCSACGAHEHL